MTSDLKTKLQSLYQDESKHSSYQNIPLFVQTELDYKVTLNEEWRSDRPRYNYILENITFVPGMIVGDIGANTGFFTLSLAHEHPDIKFIAYETNTHHVDFIRLIKQHFHMENVFAKNKGITLSGIEEMDYHHLLLLLNVLHHAGYDFDTYIERGNYAEFREYAVSYLTKLGQKTSKLVFQMGYNWGGQKSLPIISPTDDIGKLDFSSTIFVESGWFIEKIAMATRDKNHAIVYKNFPLQTVKEIRSGTLPSDIPSVHEFIARINPSQFVGEFYRRPIFICSTTP